MEKAFLLLENGMLLEGTARGAEGMSFGQLVFNTAVAGYQDVITNPVYCGKVVCMTHPVIGNYGVNCEYSETDMAWLRGMVVNSFCDTPSNWKSLETVDEYLKRNKVVAIEGIDTRKLTRILRSEGAMNCAIWSGKASLSLEEINEKIRAFTVYEAVSTVASRLDPPHVYTAEDNGDKKVAVVDYGAKRSLIGALSRRGCKVDVFNAFVPAQDIIAGGYDGVVLSNGPVCLPEIDGFAENVKAFIDAKIPTLGVGLGCLVLARALGGSVKELKYGHFGSAQPVKDKARERTYITGQSHIHTVCENSLPNEYISHVNLNDGSIEGIKLPGAPISGVMFNPEGFPGPQDTKYIFDAFVECVKEGK